MKLMFRVVQRECNRELSITIFKQTQIFPIKYLWHDYSFQQLSDIKSEAGVYWLNKGLITEWVRHLTTLQWEVLESV